MNGKSVNLYGYYLSIFSCKADLLNAHLESVEFVAYEVPIIADVASYHVIAHAADAELDVSDWPAVAAWHSRMVALDGCGDLDEIMPREDRA